MHTTTLTKVTIIAEEVLEGRLTELVRHAGATGFTVTPCRGEGSRGLRIGSLPGGNVRIEALVPVAVSELITARLAEEYFTNYAVIAWLTEVSVLRGEKFVGPGR